MARRTAAWFIISASLLFLIGILSLKSIVSPTPVCDPSIKSKTVIVIDQSEDVPTQTTNAILERAWEHIVKNVPAGERVSIYAVTSESKNNLKAVFSSCKPRETGSQLVENAKKVTRDFEQKFKNPIREILAKKISGSDQSPIAQALTDLSLDDKSFRSSDVTKLLIFSDFLENTPKFSLYKCTNATAAIQLYKSGNIGAVQRPSFNHSEIKMHIIPRRKISSSAIQCRDAFWVWFFGDNKGSLTPDALPG
ncbi:MAG: hypothetical protein RLY95_1140 [Pseudomonadota bacterium]